MEFKVLETKHLPQVEELWDYCFEKRGTPFFEYYFSEYAGKENVILGAMEGDKLKSMLHLNPFQLSLNGREYEVPYIVGVATSPEARGRHLMGELLRYSLEYLHEKGILFVTLMPIYAGIYQPYDFAYCYQRLKYSWAPGKLSLPKEAGEAKALQLVPVTGELTLVQKKHLAEVYERFTAGKNGVPQRKAKNWQQLLTMARQEGVQICIDYAGKIPQGYAFCYVEEKVIHVHELAALNAVSKRRLVAWAESIDSTAEKVEWLAEPWDRTYLQLADQNHYPQLSPFMMARCLDAKKALESMSDILLSEYNEADKGKALSMVLELTDSLLPSNNCRLEISLADSFKTRETDKEPDFCMDIGTFTQLLLGVYTVNELREKIKVYKMEKILYLKNLFAKVKPTWNNEYV